MKGPFWPEGAKKWLSCDARAPCQVSFLTRMVRTISSHLEQSKNLDETSSQKAICKGIVLVVQKKNIYEEGKAL